MKNNMRFVTHARNTEELKDEFVSDLKRRIAGLDSYSRTVARSAQERARYACAIEALVDMLKFWEELQIIRPRRKPIIGAGDREPPDSDRPGEL